MFKLPSLLPRPPLPGESLFEVEEDREVDTVSNPDSEFRSRLKSEGYDPDLIEMGLRVMKNHMRPKEEAFKIGKEYIRSMSK